MPMIRVAAVFRGSDNVDVYYLSRGDLNVPVNGGVEIATVAGVSLVKSAIQHLKDGWYTAVPVWPRCTSKEFVRRVVSEGWTVYPAKNEQSANSRLFVGVPDYKRKNQP